MKEDHEIPKLLGYYVPFLPFVSPRASSRSGYSIRHKRTHVWIVPDIEITPLA